MFAVSFILAFTRVSFNPPAFVSSSAGPAISRKLDDLGGAYSHANFRDYWIKIHANQHPRAPVLKKGRSLGEKVSVDTDFDFSQPSGTSGYAFDSWIGGVVKRVDPTTIKRRR